MKSDSRVVRCTISRKKKKNHLKRAQVGAVMQPIVEVSVRDAVTSVGPLFDGSPPILYYAFAKFKNGKTSTSFMKDQRKDLLGRVAGNVGGSKLTIDVVDVVLLGNGASALLVCAIPNNGSVDIVVQVSGVDAVGEGGVERFSSAFRKSDDALGL
jgi:hypothetical protein